jgi:FtsP/CotA-like multicopper oxidase with cupredoxin domain
VIPEPDDQKPTRKRRGSRVCVHRTQCYCHRLEHEDMGMMANFEVV